MGSKMLPSLSNFTTTNPLLLSLCKYVVKFLEMLKSQLKHATKHCNELFKLVFYIDVSCKYTIYNLYYFDCQDSICTRYSVILIYGDVS